MNLRPKRLELDFLVVDECSPESSCSDTYHERENYAGGDEADEHDGGEDCEHEECEADDRTNGSRSGDGVCVCHELIIAWVAHDCK